MKSRFSSKLSLLINLLSVIGVLIAWVLFAPSQLGGTANYVIIRGNSMEPGYLTGDLVIVRRADEYQVGEIVAYHHPDVGVIIHRIIDEQAGRFVLKGDNNSWLDSYHPDASEVIGKAIYHLPTIGKILEQVRAPNTLASLTIILGGGVVLTTMVPNAAPTGSTKRKRRQARRESLLFFKQINANQETLYFALGLLAFISVLLGAVAFTRSLTQTVNKNVPFEHRGKFSYTAATSANIYDAEGVRTGDPIFRQLTNAVKVNFEYQVVSPVLKSANGSYRLLAEISDSTNNWKRTIELQPPTPFTNGAFTAEGMLDLNKIQALVKSVNQQTGLGRQQYSVTVLPEVITQVLISDQPLEEHFSPRMEFRVNDLEMYLANRGVDSKNDPLQPKQSGIAVQSVTQPNVLSLFGFNLEIAWARILASVGFLLSIIGIGTVWTLHTVAAASGEAALIQMKYGATMISIDSEDPAIGQQVIDVLTIDDLAKIAEHEGRMMLHGFYNEADQYFVTTESAVYRYAPKAKNKNGEPITVGAKEHESIVEGWVRALVMRKLEDRNLLFKMSELTLRLARNLGVPENQLPAIRWGVLLHDVGELALSDQILFKTSNLTEEEWRLIRAHPTFGRDLLAPTQALHPALEIPYAHHERWDGSGYPRGLRGEAIPFAARLFAVVDVWLAMRTKRPYREAYSADETRRYLREQAGKQFDPQIVKAFLELEDSAL